jgi:LmbE family N-acetylglucosaminyl deacetylase
MVIISPHIDDAIIGMGGIILKDPKAVTILDIFSISDFVNEHNTRGIKKGDAIAITEQRIEEEKRLAEKYGFTFFCMGLEDAPIRKTEVDLDAIEKFIKPHATHKKTLYFIRPGKTRPHPDHAICFEVSKRFKGAKYYPDYRYMGENPSEGGIPHVINIARKIDALQMYDSQMDDEIIKRIVTWNCAGANFIERIWDANEIDS